MFSHVTVGASSLNRAMRFYDAVLAPVGLERHRTAKIAIGYAPPDFSGVNAPFWVVRPYDGNAAAPGNGPMVAFEAQTRAAVDAFHAAALAAGGSDEGPPGCARITMPTITAPMCATRTATSCAWSATIRSTP